MACMKRHAVLGTGAIALLGACSLFTDLSGYASGGEEPAVGGLPTEPGSDGAVGGDFDASGGEGGPQRNDGSTTPSPDGGQPARFCATAGADFCEDFDGLNLGFPFSWSLTGASNATHGVDSALARSAPASLWAETALLGSGDTAFSYRYVRLGTAAHVLDYGLDIYIEKEGSPGLVVGGIGLEDVGSSGSGFLAELVLGGSVDSVRETRTTPAGTQTMNHPLLAGIKPATWTRITMQLIALGASGWGITVTASTPTSAPTTILSGGTLALWTPQPGARATASIGVVGMRGASSSWRVRIDDVALKGAK